NLSRMACCFASSREKMTIFLGLPSSPDRRRRISIMPSEPVPPVTTTVLSVSMMAFIPQIMYRLLMHVLNHCRPGRRCKARLRCEALSIQAAVNIDRLIRHDVDVDVVDLLDQREQVELVHRLRRNVPESL